MSSPCHLLVISCVVSCRLLSYKQALFPDILTENNEFSAVIFLAIIAEGKLPSLYTSSGGGLVVQPLMNSFIVEELYKVSMQFSEFLFRPVIPKKNPFVFQCTPSILKACLMLYYILLQPQLLLLSF